MWPKPRLPKWTPTQIASALVGEHVDVVVAAADRAELRARLARERLARVLAGTASHAGALEQRMVDRRVVGAVLAADAERHDRPGSRRRSPVELVGEVGRPVQGEVGADRGVAAGDVEPDADDRHLFLVGGDAADRHHVADVAVGHQRRALGAAGDVLELRERVRLVLAEDRSLVSSSS